jgi:hypothetical protein
MDSSLDLRKMVLPMTPPQLLSAHHGLDKLVTWLETRFATPPAGLVAAMLADNAMPSAGAVWLQFKLLHERLQTAMGERAR